MELTEQETVRREKLKILLNILIRILIALKLLMN